MELGQICNSAPKLERKYVEKNRRNNLKNLYNQLYSKLPPHISQKEMTLPDQIDAAIKYIKNLNMKLEKSKMHLEELRMSNKRPESSMATQEPTPINKSSPRIEIHEMNPTMLVILITGLDTLATFYKIIRLLHEEGVEVVYANFSLNGNSMLQISHQSKINGSSTVESKTTILSGKLKELLYGSSGDNDMESLIHLWDYIVESEMLGFDSLELLPLETHKSSHI